MNLITVLYVFKEIMYKMKQFLDILYKIIGKVIPISIFNLHHFTEEDKSLYNSVLGETVGILDIFD